MKKRKRNIYLYYRILLQLSSLAVTLYAIFNPISTPGGELFFSLPLTFFVLITLFPDVIKYQNGGFGLKVFYAVAIIKYLVLTVLTCEAGEFATGGLSVYSLDNISRPESYRYAIVALDLELIVAFLCLHFWYEKIYSKLGVKVPQKRAYYQSLGIMGFLLLIIIAVLIVVRGGFGDLMQFGVISDSDKLSTDNLDGHGIDFDLGRVLVCFVVIVLTGFFQRRNDRKPSSWNFVIPVTFGLLSTLLVLGSNRMRMVYMALCAIAILVKAFPKYRKSVYSIIIPALGVVLVTFTLIKQFQYSVVDQISANSKQEVDLRVDITEYACGVENIAHSFDNFLKRGNQADLSTPLIDIARFNYIVAVPPLTIIRTSLKEERSSLEILVDSMEMFSVAGQAALYGQGAIGGWLLDVIFWVIIIRLLIIFEVHSKLEKDIGRVYNYTWCAVLFGVSQCYTPITLWSNLTYNPLWLWFVLEINKLLRQRHLVRPQRINYED